MRQNAQVIAQVRKAIAKYLLPLKFNARVDNQGDVISIEPDTLPDNDRFDGIQILYHLNTQKFELSEYQAGANQNELHIFGNYNTIQAAFKRMLKGKITPIQIWN